MTAKVLACANGKGGVGKTRCSVEIAAAAARQGFRTLLVDLDGQGHSAGELGLSDQIEETDPGASRRFFAAVMGGLAPEPMATGRDNLWLIPGGEGCQLIEKNLGMEASSAGGGEVATRRVADCLNLIRDQFDLVVLDTPAADQAPLMIESSIIASDLLLMPTKIDLLSLKGLFTVAKYFAAARNRYGSNVEILGVVLFDIESRATKIRAETGENLREAFGRDDIVLDVAIRHSMTAQKDQRDNGITTVELVEVMRDREAAKKLGLRPTKAGIAAAEKLASDYEALATIALERAGLTTAVSAGIQ